MNDAQQYASNQDLEFLGFEIPDLNFDYSLHEINDNGFVCANNFECHTNTGYNTERNMSTIGASLHSPGTSCLYLFDYADLFTNEELLLSGLI